jgi:hypothetical protein
MPFWTFFGAVFVGKALIKARVTIFLFFFVTGWRVYRRLDRLAFSL